MKGFWKEEKNEKERKLVLQNGMIFRLGLDDHPYVFI